MDEGVVRFIDGGVMKMELPDLEKREVLESIQRFMAEEMEVEISEMQAESMLDYFGKELAPFAYNRGVRDAQDFLILKAEDLGGTCFEEGLRYWKDGRGGVRRKPRF